jgi:hypothetical protein
LELHRLTYYAVVLQVATYEYGKYKGMQGQVPAYNDMEVSDKKYV